MKKIETYGIKIDMKSLKEAARMSETYSHVLHNAFYYNPETGKTICFKEVLQNDYLRIDGYYHFHDSTRHMTQQQIVDKLRERIEEIWRVSENK